MKLFTQIVLTVGRIVPNQVNLLGTGFLISHDGLVATTRHVVQADDSGLCVLFPAITDLNAYQDTTDLSCKPVMAKIVELDPLRDLAVLKTELRFDSPLPTLDGFDNVAVGDELSVVGFPHAPEGRRVLTYQSARLGAKVLIGAQAVKSKHGIINTQARPGQSGSVVLAGKNPSIVGVLIGAYAALAGGGISLGGINPAELHQTTHCISAEYLKEMI